MDPEIVRDGKLILMKIGPLGYASNNAYILADATTNDAVVIDAPEGSDQVVPHLKGLNVNGVIVTHRHRDHWAGIDVLLEGVQAPVLTHEADREPYTQYVNATLEDGDEIEVGGLKLRILHTPGPYARQLLHPQRRAPALRRYPVPRRPRPHPQQRRLAAGDRFDYVAALRPAGQRARLSRTRRITRRSRCRAANTPCSPRSSTTPTSAATSSG